MSKLVMDNTGIQIPIDDLAVTYGWTGGNLTSETVVYNGVTFIKTYTYSSGVMQTESGWIHQ